MFRNARYDEVNKWVYDTDNGTVSMHDFNNNQALADQLPGFYGKWKGGQKTLLPNSLKAVVLE